MYQYLPVFFFFSLLSCKDHLRVDAVDFFSEVLIYLHVSEVRIILISLIIHIIPDSLMFVDRIQIITCSFLVTQANAVFASHEQAP